MPTRTLSVREAQQGLTYWANVASRGRTSDAPHPGRIDGQWGPRTHDALRAYVAFHAGQHGGYDSARVLAPLRSTPARARDVEFERYFVTLLEGHARLYRNLSRSPAPAPTPTPREEPGRLRPPPEREPTSGAPVLDAPERSAGSAGPALAIGAIVLAGAAAAIAWSRRRRDDRDEVLEDELLETEWVSL